MIWGEQRSLLAFLMRPGHYPRPNNYKSNARKDNLKCSLCGVMTVIMVEMIPRERGDPKPWPLCSAQCCHLGADISIVLVMDNDSYYAASMTTNDSHSPRYQWSQWRSQNIDDQEPMTFNSLPDPPQWCLSRGHQVTIPQIVAQGSDLITDWT